MFGKIVSGIIGGLILAISGAILVAFALPTVGSALGIAFPAFWIIGLVLALTASRAAKAWGRIFVTLAILSFAMPLSSLVFTGSMVAEVATATEDEEYTGVATAGTALGGGLITAVSGFFGFFLGVIFLIIGLLIGRNKEVIVVKEGVSKK